MTWTAYATVQDVSDGPSPIDVLAAASADEKVKPYAHLDDPQWRGQEVAALTSNTEGTIRSIEIRFSLDEDNTSLKPGDIINVTGHFTAKVE